MKLHHLMTGVALLCCASAQAAPAKSEKQAKGAIEFRQSIFKLVRSNVGVLGGMAKGKVPFDAQVMEKNAQRISQLSVMIEDYFHIDTSKSQVPNGALPVIWEKKEDFVSKANELTKAADYLQSVATAKDEANYKKAIGGLFQSCKGCHDAYKED